MEAAIEPFLVIIVREGDPLDHAKDALDFGAHSRPVAVSSRPRILTTQSPAVTSFELVLKASPKRSRPFFRVD